MTTPLTIPTSSDPFYEQISNLDGTDFLLSFKFNQREGCWYFSISTPAGVRLVSGIKVVCNYPLLLDVSSTPGLPLGDIIALPQTTDDSPPGLDELGIGKRVELIYNSVT